MTRRVLMGRSFLGQVPLASRFRLAQAVRCARTDDGGAVCSDKTYYLPGCPHTPPITEPKIVGAPPEAARAKAEGVSPVSIA